MSASQLDVQLSKATLPLTVPVLASNEQSIENATDATTAPPPPTTTTTTTTTTTPKTTTTTSTTSTTTPEPHTTTPAPAPYPEPSIGLWNSSCIMLKFAAQLNFTYKTKDNSTATTLYNIPSDARVYDSNCGHNTTQSIQINWGPNDAQHSMLLQFDKVNDTAKMTMLRFVLPVVSDLIPNANESQSIQLLYRGWEFSAPMKMSYHCTRAQNFNLTETIDGKDIIGHLTVRDVQVEAFLAADAKQFSTARDCDSSESSDIVPIAVGIALVALIVIVLVSYLCARRRSTSRGYMSF